MEILVIHPSSRGRGRGRKLMVGLDKIRRREPLLGKRA
ncbi:MAG: hypothetical protein ACLQM8_15020 [Limisphaerales bacterium]